MWYTEGKGDEDLNVHYFQRWNETQLKQLDLNNAIPLRCQLPYSPLSYEGTLVRIRWCVRLRMFCSGSREIVAQMPFQLISDVAASEVPSGTVPGGDVQADATRVGDAVGDAAVRRDVVGDKP